MIEVSVQCTHEKINFETMPLVHNYNGMFSHRFKSGKRKFHCTRSVYSVWKSRQAWWRPSPLSFGGHDRPDGAHLRLLAPGPWGYFLVNVALVAGRWWHRAWTVSFHPSIVSPSTWRYSRMQSQVCLLNLRLEPTRNRTHAASFSGKCSARCTAHPGKDQRRTSVVRHFRDCDIARKYVTPATTRTNKLLAKLSTPHRSLNTSPQVQ